MRRVSDRPIKIKRVVFCSGKVYYDLLKYRDAQKTSRRRRLIRVEQLYPLAGSKSCAEALKPPSRRDAKLIWCQEEPQNMGAWSFIEPRLRALFGREIAYAGRNAGASPAVGA